MKHRGSPDSRGSQPLFAEAFSLVKCLPEREAIHGETKETRTWLAFVPEKTSPIERPHTAKRRTAAKRSGGTKGRPTSKRRTLGKRRTSAKHRPAAKRRQTARRVAAAKPRTPGKRSESRTPIAREEGMLEERQSGSPPPGDTIATDENQ